MGGGEHGRGGAWAGGSMGGGEHGWGGAWAGGSMGGGGCMGMGVVGWGWGVCV